MIEPWSWLGKDGEERPSNDLSFFCFDSTSSPVYRSPSEL